ncbi:helix-turn-helix transcriptional regulator [Pedobacter arcticus]|uniref:helix-turn-helix transcriptional regulator n=1 Tax=Pedobacter arcticus TaxID=752140 RepID=UPI00037E4F78|nr:helix-turn-helix transcriptional regulator [Pedobacter arcticus]
MTNKEKFIQLVSPVKTDTLEQNKNRIKNRSMLKEAQGIALKVILKLDVLGWSQKDLALKMNVSPQYINKVVKGKENITIETQIKLQVLLDIPILASYYEKKSSKHTEEILSFQKDESYKPAVSAIHQSYTEQGKIITLPKRINKGDDWLEEM